MPLLPEGSVPYFENAIYFPILINVLERDRKTIECGPFKLKGPYINLIEGALKLIRLELKETNLYMKRHEMKVIKGENIGMFTDYKFIHGGYEEQRRYLNVRLRNRTEELMNYYFATVGS